MNTITSRERVGTNLHPTESVTMSSLDRTALASGVADRRTRLQEIETEMDQACEAAVRRTLPKGGSRTRIAWDRHAWAVYTAEAITQGRCHAAALARLRREIEHLEHLAQCVS